MKFLLLLATAFLALLFGVAAALVGGIWALVGAVLIVPLLLVFTDYRIGVVALTIVMPWAGSPLLPQAQGLNIVNYLLLFSLLSLAIPKLFARKPIVMLPKPVIWLYVLPVTVGMVLAWPHIPEGAANFARWGADEVFQTGVFLKSRFIKPLLTLVYAVLLANAVRDSKRPERLLAVLAVAALVPTAIVFSAVALYGGNLLVLQQARNFLSPFGMHANEFGLLLMTACVPLMYLTAQTKGTARVLWGLSFLVSVSALLLTFSRGAWMGFAVAVAMLLWQYRRPSHFVIVAVVLASALAAAPGAFLERLTTGVSEAGASRMGPGAGEDDKLTAGRLGAWKMLAPEVARSPAIGRGIGATAWTTAARDGMYRAAHPHNLYLEIALDLGIVGLACFAILYLKYLRGFRRLGRDEELSPTLRAYFSGGAAALVAMLVMGISNGHYMPAHEQTFFWFSLGFLFGYWDRLVPKPAADAKTTRPLVRTYSYLRY